MREAGNCAGLSEQLVDKLLAETSETQTKEELKRVTKEALDLGVSGGRGLPIVGGV